jgi:hypothetical protein
MHTTPPQPGTHPIPLDATAAARECVWGARERGGGGGRGGRARTVTCRTTGLRQQQRCVWTPPEPQTAAICLSLPNACRPNHGQGRVPAAAGRSTTQRVLPGPHKAGMSASYPRPCCRRGWRGPKGAGVGAAWRARVYCICVSHHQSKPVAHMYYHLSLSPAGPTCGYTPAHSSGRRLVLFCWVSHSASCPDQIRCKSTPGQL